MLDVKLPAYPLIAFDPLISVWSNTEKLYESETTMWTGESKPIGGHVIVDDVAKRFLGITGAENVIEQVSMETSMTATKYVFRDDKVELTVTFTSHFLMNKPVFLSRPTAFIDVNVKCIDGESHNVEVVFDFSEKLCYRGTKKLMRGGIIPYPNGNRIGYMGRLIQKTLESSGDQVSINWGWFYVAGQAKIILTGERKKNAFFVTNSVRESKDYSKVLLATRGDKISPEKELNFFLVTGYDDLYSMLYFCEFKRGYWTKGNYDILTAINDSMDRHDDIVAACKKFDERVEGEATALQGEKYAKLLVAAYRQVISSHKLISDGDDNMIWLSKECGSNGCVGTVDVSYPSCPLFLWAAPEYVKAMLLPVFREARLKNWVFDFAPHDVGQYPYATGQVYGASSKLKRVRNRWFFGNFKKQTCEQVRNDLYRLEKQMPIEESANMIIMTAAYFNETGDVAFVNENAALLGTWADYLVKAGIQLANQLCTDDFAGHLEKNVNLAIKSIIAIALWGKLMDKIFNNDGGKYLKIAKKYASELEKMADLGDRWSLALDDRKSWSLKYNMVWDKLFNLGLFSEETYRKEIEFYKTKYTTYGVPLDSRADVTKSDWELWVAAMDDEGDFADMIYTALVKFLEETPDKSPFTDKYDAATGRKDGNFAARTVQGGLFIQLYKQKLKEKGGYLFEKPLEGEQ